jgi:intracellular septation protein A
MSGEAMYANSLLSVFIALIAFMVIGGILNSVRLVKAAGVLMVATVATALILWLLMGLSPVPAWFPKAVVRLVQAGRGLGRR